jgi:type II secretory pathway component PulJ
MRETKIQLGYTLFEVVICIMIMGVIGGMFMGTIVEGSRTFAFIESQNEASFNAQFTLKRILLECRQAAQVTQADAAGIAFINAYSESVRVSLNGTVLSLSTDGGANFYPLSESVSAFDLGYYDNMNNQLARPVADPGAIHSINILVEAEKNGIRFPLKAKAYLRTKPK